MPETREEFEKRMLKTYPLFYKDLYKSPMRTCMAWGFEIGPGWYPLLEELTSKIYPIVLQQYEESKKTQTHCQNCGRGKSWHWFFAIWTTIKFFFVNKFNAFILIPKRRKIYKRWGYKNITWVAFRQAFKYTPMKPCLRFEYYHAYASQIKEKFASLRIYTDNDTDEIDALIDEYEYKSTKTCEVCGEPGEIRDGGWLKCLCEGCKRK